MTIDAKNEKLTTISKNAQVATLINTFTVEPENQQRLIELWVEITEDVMCKLPGFIAANFHKSLNGKHAANYAQWRGVESIENMRECVKNNEQHQYLRGEVLKIAKMNPVVYKVCYTRTIDANNEKLTTISKNAQVTTLINTFTVEPENQQRLFELWMNITEDVMCKLPGFIAANFHKSLDGKHAANYAQWRGIESIEKLTELVKNNERHQYLRDETLKIAKSNPVLYEVCYTKNM